LDGIITTWSELPQLPAHANVFARGLRRSALLPRVIKQAIVYTLCWGLILLVAMLNPKGFLLIMEKVTSLGLNAEAGLFIVWMLITSRKVNQQPIPFEVPNILWHLRWVVGGYFVFAMLYDFVSIVAEAAGYNML
jgi:hypothetical protein